MGTAKNSEYQRFSKTKTPAFDLVEFASDAAFAIDADSKIVAWNALAEHLVGYTPNEVIGQFCGDILRATLPSGEPLCHPVPSLGCDVFQCFQHCQPYGIPSCRIKRQNGEWISASISSLAMSARARRLYGNAIMAIVFIRDGAAATTVPQHHTLQVFTLGGFGMVVAGHSIDIGKWKRKKATTLLKYLTTQLDRPVHRERLIDALWPGVDEKLAWGRLKVTIYYLRRELRENGIRNDVLKTIGNTYLLKRNTVWVDVDAFEKFIIDGRKLQQQKQWNDALNCYFEARHLYRGNYLEEETFADWCAEERERLHELYLEVLTRAAECHAELNQYAEAIHICRKALVFDPCRENFHCALMKYLVKCDRPDLALIQYHHCQQVLTEEFGTEPLLETQSLYQQILKGVDGIKANDDGRN